MGSIKKIITTTTTTKKQNKTRTYFPISSLSLICAYLLTNLKLTSVLFTIRHASVNSSCAQLPPPGLLRGISTPFQSRGGAFANFALSGGRAFVNPGGYSPAFDMHSVSCQIITTQKILLEKTHIGSSVKERGL